MVKKIKVFSAAGLLWASLFSVSVLAAEENPNNVPLEKEGIPVANAAENVAPAVHNVPKEQNAPALNYVNQPPLIPHSVSGMQVTKNVNQCLNCHSAENSRITGATRISPTHFMSRDGAISPNASPRRYFCLQCHVPQTDAKAIVPNEFKPLPGYGQ